MSDLSLLQSQKAEIHPDYLNELLDNNYLCLYDHLMTMRKLGTWYERDPEIKKIPLEESSIIISKVKDALIEKVKSIISNKYLDIYFILGYSCSGKSTSLCFLRGDKVELKSGYYSDSNNLIGNSLYESRTFLPEFGKVGHKIFIEFPGFWGSNGKLVQQGIKLALKELVQIYDPKFIILRSINFDPKTDLVSELVEHSVNLDRCILGITHYSRNVNELYIKCAKKSSNNLKKEELNIIQDIEILKEFQKTSDNKVLDNLNDTFFKQLVEKYLVIDKIIVIEKIILIKEEQLLKLQKEIELNPHKLLETIEYNEKIIEKSEKTLVRLTELPNFIRFKDLEKDGTREICLEQLDNFAIKKWRNDMVSMLKKPKI